MWILAGRAVVETKKAQKGRNATNIPHLGRYLLRLAHTHPKEGDIHV